ncbi:MAG TPA: acyltransferase family protein, partial [Polyangiaceae bacterium]
VGCNELARQWLAHPSIAAPPTLTQLLAHATFLTDLLGFEPLTAGVWYLAIDFQLLALSLLLLALSQTLSRWLFASKAPSGQIFASLSGALAAASLLWASRHRNLDAWAIYFFGSYFLGMLVEWVLRGTVPRWTAWACSALVACSLAHEFRPRLFVALVTALLLFLSAGGSALGRWPQNRCALGLGKISYSLFLVHFPVCVLVNAWGSHYLCGSPRMALLGMFAAFVLSVVTAVAFHVVVEARCLGLGRSAPEGAPRSF